MAKRRTQNVQLPQRLRQRKQELYALAQGTDGTLEDKGTGGEGYVMGHDNGG